MKVLKKEFYLYVKLNSRCLIKFSREPYLKGGEGGRCDASFHFLMTGKISINIFVNPFLKIDIKKLESAPSSSETLGSKNGPLFDWLFGFCKGHFDWLNFRTLY